MAIEQSTTTTLCNGNGHHKTELSRLHPSKVRVKFVESQSLAQVRPSSTPSSPDVTLDLSSDTMTSPGSENIVRISVDTGVDNPFRPDGELSREADTIVSLIKEGKPITILKNEDLVDGAVVVANGQPKSPDSTSPVREGKVSSVDASSAKTGGANGSVAAKDGNKRQKAQPGVVDVKHSVIPAPTDTPQVEQVTIKKKPKGRCCVIQ